MCGNPFDAVGDFFSDAADAVGDAVGFFVDTSKDIGEGIADAVTGTYDLVTGKAAKKNAQRQRRLVQDQIAAQERQTQSLIDEQRKASKAGRERVADARGRLNSRQQGATNRSPSTLLTGPGGVPDDQLNLGRKTLLGQ